jgi:hypothetical protein
MPFGTPLNGIFIFAKKIFSKKNDGLPKSITLLPPVPHFARFLIFRKFSVRKAVHLPPL